ncbi:MAG: hypothetical protein LLG00_08775 [Planctomycetaceae bacterium]|nr:hypothetical protein [Planctomycetaceae bacterium]
MPGIFDPYHRWLGIPLKDQPPNHYRLLGVELFEADPEVIRDAAEQRIAHVRTYQLGRYSALSQKILNELAAAKACLLDPKKKAAYDQQLSRRPSGAPPASHRVVSPPPVPSQLFKRPAARPKRAWLLPLATAAAALLVVGGVAAFMRTTPTPTVPKIATATQRKASKAAHRGKSVDIGRKEETAVAEPARAPSAQSATTNLTSNSSPAGFESAQAEQRSPHMPDALTAATETAKRPAKVGNADTSGVVRIAVDTYHNDLGPWILRCAANHPTAADDSRWSAIQAPLCQESLQGCDILVVAHAGRLKSYGSKEYDAVARFVYDGGGLLITGAARGGVPQGTDMEQIGAPFGLLMTTGTCPGNPAQFTSHPIASGLARLSWPKTAATNSHITLSSGAVPVAYDAKHRTVCAVASPGRGRVCMMSTSFITWGCDPHFPQYGRLLRRVCQWLAKRDEAGHEAPFDGDSSVTKPDRPKKRRGIHAGSEGDDGTSRPVALKLPSGVALTEVKLEMPHNWEDKLYPEGLSIYRAEYPGGSVRALVTISEAAKNKGKFHGWVATLHANGGLQTLAQYKDGELDGPRKRWAEDGTRLFYAEYKRGKKDGVLCLFQKGRPRWIEEWKWQSQKAPQNEYLVKVASDGFRLVPANQATSDEKEEMQKARQEAFDAQRDLTTSEMQLKQETRKKFAEELERRKHKELTKQAPARLQRQLDRTRQHAQEREAGFDKARSRAWGKE